jgi:hypothetical protein
LGIDFSLNSSGSLAMLAAMRLALSSSPNKLKRGDVPGDVFLAVLAALESDGVALEEI